ncbi:MAG: c-type cytochrome [Usitatibacter sp.]
MRTKWLAALAAFAFTASFAQAPAGDAARGQALFMKNMCWTCHGTAGQGGDRDERERDDHARGKGSFFHRATIPHVGGAYSLSSGMSWAFGPRLTDTR